MTGRKLQILLASEALSNLQSVNQILFVAATEESPQRKRRGEMKSPMLGSQKRYFIVFSLILTLVVGVVSAAAWTTYQEMTSPTNGHPRVVRTDVPDAVRMLPVPATLRH